MLYQFLSKLLPVEIVFYFMFNSLITNILLLLVIQEQIKSNQRQNALLMMLVDKIN